MEEKEEHGFILDLNAFAGVCVWSRTCHCE